MHKFFKRMGLALMLFVAMLSFSILSPSKAIAAMIGKQEEIKMGQDVSKQLEAQYGLVHDEDLQERINRIGQSLVKQSARQDLEYTFKVLNSDEINAMAVPGGFVYVFKGLVDFMPSDDELAGVLGHEIGHVVKRHTVHQIEKELALSLFTILAGVASGDGGAGIILASTASQALMAGYSRADERQADEEGFLLTTKAGYNPYSIYVTMCKLNDLAVEEKNPGYGLFASHPEPEVRMKKSLKALEALHITPGVELKPDKTARVKEGDWYFDFTQKVGSDKPEYRARMLAGALYLVRKRGGVDETHFITVDTDTYSDIFYEDIHILRVYGADAVNTASISDYAAQVVTKLQDWVKELQKKP